MCLYLWGERGRSSRSYCDSDGLFRYSKIQIFFFFPPIGVNEVDYSLYPNRKLQEQWLRSYLEAYKEYKGFGTEVSEKEVEVLYVQVNQFALVNNNLWI